MNLSLSDAFARFGAKPSNRLRGLSAMATDGAMVLNCSKEQFAHPSRGVLRYEDKLSRQPTTARDTELLGRHLTLARDGALPVRMVVCSQADNKSGGRSSSWHIRTDLIGKVAEFDGDHFIVDFVRELMIPTSAAARRK